MITNFLASSFPKYNNSRSIDVGATPLPLINQQGNTDSTMSPTTSTASFNYFSSVFALIIVVSVFICNHSWGFLD